MSFPVPSGWKFQSSANNGNSVTYTRPGHTTVAPRLAIFSRVIPSYDVKADSWSTPSYRIRLIDGVLTPAGKPAGTRVSFDGTFRYPMDAAGVEASGNSITADLKALISATGFAGSVFVSQDFPAPATV